ncbi:MAG: hypothetical protein EOO03_00555 [Chitinophagaceae bacterium]|nr:MAG: hypothetical protein EOO03_00555 [Chitinophagaceae bacterium]
MAINKNHEFEELDGVKCGIVEKEASAERVAFLKSLLALNGYTVVVVASPPPKAAAVKPTAAGTDVEAPQQPVPSNNTNETFTIGVTDYTFNSINAIFGRQLRTQDGRVVTQAYWQQREPVSNDEIPYFENRSGF